MYEGANFNLGGADFSNLAPKPPKTPEVIKDDDDNVEEDKKKPKTLLEILKESTEDKKEDSKKPEKEPEKPEKPDEESSELDADNEDGETDPAEDSEVDSNKPEMSTEEEQEVTSAILENRNEEIHAEADSADTQEAKDEAIAAGIFVEATKQAVDEGMPIDEAIDTGKAVALEVLQINEPHAQIEIDSDDMPESDPESATPEAEILDPVEVDPVDDDDPSATTGPSATTTIPPTPPVPPIPPVPMGGGHGFGPGHTPPTPDLAPITTTETDPEDSVTRRHGHAKYVLAGGIVGYLLGRRRGRIKTEKKLLPVQRKLEKEVAGLHGKIAWNEASVRAMVQEQMAKKPETVERQAELQKRLEKQNVEQNRTNQKNEQDSKLKLGRFGLAGESPSQAEIFKTPENLKPVDLMTVPELLVIAEKIEIEQSTVRKLYETNRIDYEGLRRIIRAYLKGERLDKIVRENLLSPEKYSYPETLTTNTPSSGQTVGGGGADSDLNIDPNVTKSAREFSNSPIFPSEYSQAEQYTKKNNSPQKYGVVAGVIVAIILLIFIVFR